MIKILITGKNSYVGTNLKKWLEKYENYRIETISVREDTWKRIDLSKYNVIIHTAGLVHIKENINMKNYYYQVNTRLPIDIATLAKKAGVKQFIFMSTMAVYGEEGKIGQQIVITHETKPNPKTLYGKSKLEAEIELQKLASKEFKLVVVRPPMIYGPDCPGNYKKLIDISGKTPIFPLVNNYRSVLNIEKLCNYIKEYIDSEVEGVFLPQDDEYMNTSQHVKKLGKMKGKDIYLSKTLGSIVAGFSKRVNIVNKIFGNLVYKKIQD